MLIICREKLAPTIQVSQSGLVRICHLLVNYNISLQNYGSKPSKRISLRVIERKRLAL